MVMPDEDTPRVKDLRKCPGGKAHKWAYSPTPAETDGQYTCQECGLDVSKKEMKEALS